MAFKMNRPIIKGTTKHKASIAKAKSESIVSQRRVTADKSLVESGKALGQSYIPQAIDYSIDMPEIKVSKKKKKKKEEKLNNKNRQELQELKVDTGDKKPKKAKEPKYKDYTDKFFKAAEEAGINIKNKKDYEKAQRILVYDDKTRNWRQRTEKIEVGDVTSKKNKSAEEKKIQKEIEAQQAEIMRIEIERQAEKKRIAEEKLKEKQRIKNKKTTKKKQDIEEAKEWYGKDITLTRERFEKYNEMKRVEQEISELPDRYFDSKDVSKEEKKLEKISFKPQVLPDETTTTSVEPKRKDFKTPSDYMRARMKYYKQLEKSGPAKMRDDRIWRNAIKGGKVQKNMLKMGYIPLK